MHLASFILGCFLTTSLIAQQKYTHVNIKIPKDLFSSPIGPDDPEFLSMYDTSNVKNILHATWTQEKYLSFSKISLKSRGKLIIWRNHALLWQIDWPYQSTILIKQNKIIDLQDSRKTISIHPQLLSLLSGLLNGNFVNQSTTKIFNTFKIYLTKNPDETYLGLIPTNTNFKKIMQKIIVKQTHFIDDILLVSNNQQQTLIHFFDHAFNDKLTTKESEYLNAP